MAVVYVVVPLWALLLLQHVASVPVAYRFYKMPRAALLGPQKFTTAP